MLELGEEVSNAQIQFPGPGDLPRPYLDTWFCCAELWITHNNTAPMHDSYKCVFFCCTCVLLASCLALETDTVRTDSVGLDQKSYFNANLHPPPKNTRPWTVHQRRWIQVHGHTHTHTLSLSLSLSLSLTHTHTHSHTHTHTHTPRYPTRVVLV